MYNSKHTANRVFNLYHLHLSQKIKTQCYQQIGVCNKFETFTYENFYGHGVYAFFFFLMRLEFDA